MTEIGRLLRIGAAIVLLLAGAILAPTPLPVGWVLIIIGLSLLLHESKWARNRLRRLRERYPAFGERLNKAKTYAPGFARRLIERTDPLRRRRRQRAEVPVRVDDTRQPPSGR